MTLSDLHDICYRIRKVFPNAAIGGGAPRDVFLGAPVKDIDVFVYCPPENFGSLCYALALGMGGEVTTSMAYVHAPSYDIQVAHIPYPLNVVLRDCDPLEDVADYDFGISQIAVTPTVVVKTNAFMKDLRDNTVTYMHADKPREDWHRLSSAKRLQRILAKHPSLTPRRCEALENAGGF